MAEDVTPVPIDDFLARREGKSGAPDLTTGQKIVRQSALPVAGGAIGAALGTLAAPVTAGLGNPVTGAMLGSAAGEFVNQKLGITDPSALNIAISGAAPTVPAVGRHILNLLPGAAAGLQKAMQNAIGMNGEKVIEAILPKAPSGQLWEQFYRAGRTIMVGTDKLRTALGDITDQLTLSEFPKGVSGTLTKSLQAMIGTTPGQFVDIKKFRANMSDLGAIIGQLEDTGKTRALGAAKKLYGAMWDELDDVLARTTGPEATLLHQAVDATKREVAEGMLTRWVSTATSYRLGTRQIDTNGLLTKIERNAEELGRLLPKADIAALKDTLIPFAKSTPLMPSAIPRSSTEKLVGLVTGSDTIARLLISPTGREAVRLLAEHSGKFDTAVSMALQGAGSAMGLRGQGAVPVMTPPGLVQQGGSVGVPVPEGLQR